MSICKEIATVYLRLCSFASTLRDDVDMTNAACVVESDDLTVASNYAEIKIPLGFCKAHERTAGHNALHCLVSSFADSFKNCFMTLNRA
ncbi:hypothetical protein LFADAHJC_LOCUS2458 [Methylorubrum extorquens]